MSKILQCLVVTLLIFTVKLTAQAPTIEWQKSYGGNKGEVANSVIQTSDGGYIVVGTSNSQDAFVTDHHGDFTSEDCFVVKISSTGSVQWKKSLGSTSGEQGYSVVEAVGGGFVIAATTYSDGSYGGDVASYGYSGHAWIVKLSANGALIWQQKIPSNSVDVLKSIKKTSDGGYILAGEISDSYWYKDCWLVKLAGNGAIQWQRTYGGSYIDYANDAQQTADGGYIMIGTTASDDGDVSGRHGDPMWTDLWVVKTDNVGNIQWSKCYGGSWGEYGTAVQQTANGNYILAGYARSIDGDITGNHGNGNYDSWLINTDMNGAILWQHAYGSIYDEYPNSIKQTYDGGYVVGGWTNAINDNGDVTGRRGFIGNNAQDFWAFKTDASGTIQWGTCYGGNGYEYANAIDITADGGYIIAGESNYNDVDVTGVHNINGYNYNDFWVVKLKSPCSSPSISGPNQLCINSTITLSNNGFCGNGVWVSQNNKAIVNPLTGVVTGKNAGTAVLSYKVLGIPLTNYSVTVNALPAVPQIAYAPGSPNPQNGAPPKKYCADRTFFILGSPANGIWTKNGSFTVTPVGIPSTFATVYTGIGASVGNNITYTYTDGNGCSKGITVSGDVVICPSPRNSLTESEGVINDFVMSPNPAKSNININTNFFTGEGVIVINDIYGKQLKMQILSIGTNKVDITQLSKGLYLVSVINNKGRNTKKLIIE